MDIGHADFKQAMRRLASTIALVTSGQRDQWTGMAATAVVSVTTDPPTMLVAVNQTASLYPVLVETGTFCVNLLGANHQDLVGVFSGVKLGSERFDHGNWRPSKHGLPVLVDAVASIVCKVTNQLDVGTHSIFVGEASEIENHPRIDPLLWVNGSLALASAA